MATRFVLVAVIALGSSGCLLHWKGKPFDLDAVNQLEVGTATKQEIKDTLGHPYSSYLNGDNEVWQYFFSFDFTISLPLLIVTPSYDISHSFYMTNFEFEDETLASVKWFDGAIWNRRLDSELAIKTESERHRSERERKNREDRRKNQKGKRKSRAVTSKVGD